MEKKLFLLDAYALIYRSYYAFIRNPRINSKGFNTSAIFGFVNTLEELLRKEKPSHIGVAFDLSAPTFRHVSYSEYKANREETPEDIRKAVPIIKEIIRAYYIPVLECEGFEADDVIGTLAKKAESKGFAVYMVTPDKDYSQLVSDNIFVYKPRRGDGDVEIIGSKQVCEEYNIDNPAKFIDILALWGDTSDNIPGAPGIGEKTAAKLISEFGSLENLIQNTSKLKGKQKESIENNIELIERAKFLVTISLTAPIEFDEDAFCVRSPEVSALKSLFTDLEFRTMAQKLSAEQVSAPESENQPKPRIAESVGSAQLSLFDLPSVFAEKNPEPVKQKHNTIKDIDHNYIIVETAEQRNDLISRLKTADEFCFDTETTGTDTINDELVGMSFSVIPHEAYYVPLSSKFHEAEIVVNEFRPVFENENSLKIGQNIKFDILMLKNYGVQVKGKIFDTMLAHYLLHPESRHNMTFLAENYLNYTPVPIEDLIGKKGKGQLSMRSVDLRKIAEYAAEDADITLQLKKVLESELIDANLKSLAEDIEMPLVNVLSEIENNGVTLNSDALKVYSKQLIEEILEIEKKIFEYAGIEFNISSPKQLGEILFDRMKLDPAAKKTKTDQYSTGEEVLEKISDKHPIVGKILEYRGLKKLLSTYVDALPELINKKTGKIHTSFNQALTATGRLSSNNPNLQNIPVRDEKGREIRKAFISSSSDCVFMSADYSQIELRIMAHLSEDQNMLDAFNNNLDIHTATAAKIFGISENNVTSDMRRKAKTANFGIIYGISAWGLAARLNISRSEAKQLIDGYFHNYPMVRSYMEESIRKARAAGYVETIFGRRRYLSDINSNNATVRSFAERNAINSPIQGSAADIIKIAMINIQNAFFKEGVKSKMILQVHDELNFDVLNSEIELVREIIRREMMGAARLLVPLEVEVGYGANWLEAH